MSDVIEADMYYDLIVKIRVIEDILEGMEVDSKVEAALKIVRDILEEEDG